MTVHVPWSSKINTLPQWDNVCVEIIERFGLPGGKYTTELTENYMNFTFQNDNEGLLCQLLVSDYI